MNIFRVGLVFLLLLLGTCLPTVSSTPPVPALSPKAASLQGNILSATQLTISHVQILFQGNVVTELVAGSNAKEYRLNITGAGFHRSSVVLLGGKKTRTTFVSRTQLTAKVKQKLLSSAGDFTVSVENADGTISNAIVVDVVSPSSVLSIASLSPNVSPVGTTVTITGTGFTATGNFVRLLHFPSGDVQGFQADVGSSDGVTLQFTVTSSLCPKCSFTIPSCAVACLAANPGEYLLSVTNANGLSNSLPFLLSSPSGPIGAWGTNSPDPPVRVEVTDTSIIVDGPCFTGVVSQTLVTDASGNFSLNGSFIPQAGPVGQDPIPAVYSGSVSNGVMTLTITIAGTSQGPYLLVFGNDIAVPKPCV